MRLKLHFLFIFLFIALFSFSNNDRYRLIINDDPSTSITIAWDQTSGSNPKVYYGTSDFSTNWQSYPNEKSVDRQISFRGMDNRFARLTGLLPNTSYYFVIHDSQGTSQRFWFKTAPDDDSRLSFIAGGDSRNNRTPRQRANLLVSKLKPHAVLFGGDMTDDDTNSQWIDWFDDWQLTIANDGRMFPIIAARGNHEYNSSSVYNLFDTPNQDSYYAVTFGDNMIRCYTLNSEISVLGNQKSWLENDLNNNNSVLWKMAQYHKPMRPHTSSKSEGNDIYNAWAQLFYDEGVNLVVDCDSHTVKTTYPVKPSNGSNSEEGFEIDLANGTVYTGEGCWGAPLRSNNDDKNWTRNSGSFNQFKLIFVGTDKIELRTIKVDNANLVGENSNSDPFQLPSNLDVFLPSPGEDVIDILPNNGGNPCPDAGTACDDGDSNTVNDIEDGNCNCSGIPTSGSISITVTEDAEEGQNGSIYLNSSDLELVFDSFNSQNNQTVGLRFGNIPLPSNATINNAIIRFTVDETTNGATNLFINGEYTDDADSFTTGTNDISSRTKTSIQNQVSWTDVPSWDSVGDSNEDQETPDLSAIVQQILSHPNWTQNNAMVFIITGSGSRIAESIDGDINGAAELVIDYSLNTAPICNTPTGISISSITSSSINISWDLNSSPSDGYEWVVMPQGITPNTTAAVASGTVNSITNNVQVTGLNHSTTYDVFIRTDCGTDGQSNWSASTSFTTLDPNGSVLCTAPQNLFTTNIGVDSVDFSWTSVSGASNGYVWIVMPNGVTPSITNATSSGNVLLGVSSVSATGLSATTDYQIYIRSDCSADGISSWSNSVSITTLQDTSNCPAVGTPCNDGNSNTNYDEEDGNCNCIGISNNSTVEDFPVLISSDDAEEEVSGGSMDLTSSDLELTFESGTTNQLVGLRFDDIIIPAGKVIHRAFIQFQVDNDNNDLTNLVIRGEKSSNSQTFSSSSNNISNRNKTNTTVEWNNVPEWSSSSIGQAGADQRTPNLSYIIDEIIYDTNWSSGDPLTFIITGTGEREAESFDGTAAPILRIVYGDPLPPLNDNACDAFQLNMNTSSSGTAYTQQGATLQLNEPSANFNGLDSTVWFKFIAPLYGNVQIRTDISGGTLNDTEIAVYEVMDCNDFSTYSQLGYDQDSATGSSMSLLNLYDLDPGETYYIQVDKNDSTDNDGSFGIAISDLSYRYLGSNFFPNDPSGQIIPESVLYVEEGTAVINANTTLKTVFVSPNAVLDIDANLTSDVVFESDINGSGQLADVSGSSILGKVTVHRYIPAATNNRRAFRFLSSSVDTDLSIHANWQEGGLSPSGYGTHITGSTTGDNGFDISGSGNPSMFVFNQGINNWESIDNTDINKLSAGDGYLLMIRGDRNYDLTTTNDPNSDVILRAKGNIHTGSFTANLSTQGGFFGLLGNPYQAIVDYNLLTKSNINPFFIWVWDPNIGTRGGYVTVIIPSGVNTGSSEASQFIQPGQSIFVQTLNNGSSSVSFTESAKSVNQSPSLVFSSNAMKLLKMSLYTQEAFTNAQNEIDALMIIFDENANNNFNQQDAVKLMNFDENIARVIQGNYASIESRSMPIGDEELELYTGGLFTNDYVFAFDLQNIDNTTEIFIKDNYTGEISLLVAGNNLIPFTVDTDVSDSYAEDRFSLLFDNTLSTSENIINDNIKIFPIPSKDGYFFIETKSDFSGHDITITIFDIIGKPVMTKNQIFNQNSLEVDASELSSGTYIVEFKHKNYTYSHKLIIE